MQGSQSADAASERGQVIVLFALLIPVIFAIGSVVMSVGNWYVLKRHLQTQVDSAALAGGPAFTGCFHAPLSTNDRSTSGHWSTQATRCGDPTPATTYNLQLEQAGDSACGYQQRRLLVRGGNRRHGPGDDTIRLGRPDRPSTGVPANERYLDVKGDGRPMPRCLGVGSRLLSGPKARARVEISKVESIGDRGAPLSAFPKSIPGSVAVLFVTRTETGTVRRAALARP